MGLENQSLPAVSKSRYKDTYTPLLCVRFPLKEKKEKKLGMPEIRSLSTKQKKRVGSPIKQMPGTPLMHNLQNRKGGRVTKPVLEAEGGLLSMAHSRRLRAIRGARRQEQDPQDTA